MNRLKKGLAVLMIVSLLLSLLCVYALCLYPSHTHDDANHCVLCTIAANAGSLLKHEKGLGVSQFSVLMAAVALMLFFIGVTRRALWRETPISLKTKLLN